MTEAKRMYAREYQRMRLNGDPAFKLYRKQKLYEWRDRNREAILLRAKARRAARPDLSGKKRDSNGLTKYQRSYRKHRDARRESSKQRYARDREKIRARYRELYANNIEKRRAYWRSVNARRSALHIAASIRWQKEHPHEQTVISLRYHHGRRARELGSDDGTVTNEALSELLASASSCCYCLRSFDGSKKSIDHIVPLSRKGIHGMSNLAVCCLSCNKKKQAKPLNEWMKECKLT